MCPDSNQPLVNEIAKSLRWSPAIAAMADRVVAGMTAAGDGDFNSLHLRIEKDARDWAAIMGGVEVRHCSCQYRPTLSLPLSPHDSLTVHS